MPITTLNTIVAGQLTGQTPTNIDPIINGSTCSTDTFQFVADQYIPLYYGPSGATPAIDPSHSAALPPVYSNHDSTVTIKIKPGLKWSDGSPVDGQDVAFFYYVLKAATNASPANWCQYASSTQFPYNVKTISYSGNTVVMHLTHSVNPTWFTYNQLQDTNGGVYPLPATDWDVNSTGQKLTDWATNPTDALAIYNNLNNTNGADSPAQFATSPLWKVVDGGFKLQSFSITNSSYVLVPNKSYGLSPKPSFTYDDNAYTSETALLDAMESGSVEIGQLDAGTQLGSIPTLTRDGFSVFGAPEWGWFGGFVNFKDTTNHFNKVAGQQYMRGVFAELINQSAIVSGVYHGWAVAAYGPVASAPSSPSSAPSSCGRRASARSTRRSPWRSTRSATCTGGAASRSARSSSTGRRSSSTTRPSAPTAPRPRTPWRASPTRCGRSATRRARSPCTSGPSPSARRRSGRRTSRWPRR